MVDLAPGGGGEGRVLSVDGRVEGSGSVPNLGSVLKYGFVWTID